MGGYAAKVHVEIHCATKFLKKGVTPNSIAQPLSRRFTQQDFDNFRLLSQMQKTANERENKRKRKYIEGGIAMFITFFTKKWE